MTERFTLYSQSLDELPASQMPSLQPSAEFSSFEADRGTVYSLAWDDITVLLNVMPRERIREHLEGVVGYISHIYGGKPDERGDRLIERIKRTTLVVSIEIEPKRDGTGRVESVLERLAYATKPIVFYLNAFFDHKNRAILGSKESGGSFDPGAEI